MGQPAAAAADDRPADPLEELLALADDVVEQAVAIYGGPRELPPEQGRGLFVWRQEVRYVLGQIGARVVRHDFGRSAQADVVGRVRALVKALGAITLWAILNRGRQQAPWQPASDKEAADPVKYGRPPAESDRAEGERIVLWGQLGAARTGLELLRPKGPQQGCVPPDRFRWGGAEAVGLSRLQFKLLEMLTEGSGLREPVLTAEVIASLYGVRLASHQAIADYLERLKKLVTRTQRKLTEASVRLWFARIAQTPLPENSPTDANPQKGDARVP
jgi:hypothetical protein